MLKRWYYSTCWLLLMVSVADGHGPVPDRAGAAPDDPFSLFPDPVFSLDTWDDPARRTKPAQAIAESGTSPLQDADVRQVVALQALPELPIIDAVQSQGSDARQFSGSFASNPVRFDVGLDLYTAPEFEEGLIIVGKNVAMKLGGYVKADFIYDFDPIDSTDSFITTSIPVGAPDRTNARAHTRQTRLSFDTRWKTGGRVVQVFVEGDFFSDNNQFRLRHAYGEVGEFLVGRTWTTFTDVGAAPATLDFEGSVSNVNRRQAQIRWNRAIIDDVLTFAFALEDTRFIVIPPPGIDGESRSSSPDVVGRIRLERDWGKFQSAYLFRRAGFQTDTGKLLEGNAWGFNFTGTVLLLESTKSYYQILFGEGIGSYRGLPDAAPVTASTGQILPLFGWMVGVTHQWNEKLGSNFTYAENRLENAPLQAANDVSETSYLAVNLVWSPLDRVKVGIEYLYGVRQNVDQARADAHRVQTAVAYFLP